MNYLEDNGQLKTYTGSKITPNELEKKQRELSFFKTQNAKDFN